jgi:hypothetical protein
MKARNSIICGFIAESKLYKAYNTVIIDLSHSDTGPPNIVGMYWLIINWQWIGSVVYYFAL